MISPDLVHLLVELFHFRIRFFFPEFLIPAFLISLAYRQLAIGYLNTGRDLRRLQSNSTSPLYSGFQELLEGIVSVRAFSAEGRFLADVHVKIDETTKVRLHSEDYF